jgi:acetyl esterase/lipase
MKVSSLKNFEGSKEAVEYKERLRKIMAMTANCKVDYEAESRSGEYVNWHLLDCRGYKIEHIGLENCSCKLLVADYNKETEKVIMFLHGGAYYQGLDDKYLVMAKNFSEAFNKSKVLIVDYRLAPRNLYPAALNDAVDSYKYLLLIGYKSENIIFAGDSAGGGLALSSALYLKEHNIEMPKAIITFSASTNACCDGDSWTKNLDIDPLLGKHTNPDLIKPIYAGKEELKNPYISALYGDLKGLPKLLMQVGTHEVILSDTLDFAEKAKKAGVEIKQTIYQGMFHVFQVVPNLPEGKEAWKEVHEFLMSIYSGGDNQ